MVPVLSLLLRDRGVVAERASAPLSPSTIAQLESEATRRGVTPDELVAELLGPGGAPVPDTARP